MPESKQLVKIDSNYRIIMVGIAHVKSINENSKVVFYFVLLLFSMLSFILIKILLYFLGNDGIRNMQHIHSGKLTTQR